MEIIGKRVDYISFPSAGLEKSVGSRSKAARRPLLPCANSCPCGVEQLPAGQGDREKLRHGDSRRPRGSEGLPSPGSVLSGTPSCLPHRHSHRAPGKYPPGACPSMTPLPCSYDFHSACSRLSDGTAPIKQINKAITSDAAGCPA